MARDQEAVHSHHFMTQEYTHWWDVPFGVLTSVLPQHNAIPFMLFIFLSSKTYQCVNYSNQHIPLAVYLDVTTLFKANALL